MATPDTPCRRLEKDEAARLYQTLCSAWAIHEHYWWPLSVNRPPHTECFQDHYFTSEFGEESLRRILTAHGVTHLYEHRESGESYELSVSSFEPYYNGLEGFWTDKNLDWIIYASHENSITIGGEWLLADIKAAWPNWQQRIWTTPFFERPQ